MAVDERAIVHRDDPSQASSRDENSIKLYSENDSLLSPATAASTPDYKLIATFPDVESAQNGSHIENETAENVTNGAAIIISLLLIGYCHNPFIKSLCTNVPRCFHTLRRWYLGSCNIRYNCFRVSGSW